MIQKLSLKGWVFVFMLLAFASIAIAAEPESIRITTARGVEIEAKLHRPANSLGLAPALVLAPGQGYHMDLPLIAGIAEKATAAGFLVVRFNWHFFTNNLEGPADITAEALANEIDDMNSALRFVVAREDVDLGKVVVAGKSLGSLVANHVTQQNLHYVQALALLTPVCEEGMAYYPGLSALTVPTGYVLGNRDPACSIQDLYRFLATTARPHIVSMLAGDHSFRLGTPEQPATPEADAANTEAAVDTTIYWLKQAARL